MKQFLHAQDKRELLNPQHLSGRPNFVNWISFAAESLVVPFAVLDRKIKLKLHTHATIVARKELNVFDIFPTFRSVGASTGTEKLLGF
jgi:hypothetical protein